MDVETHFVQLPRKSVALLSVHLLYRRLRLYQDSFVRKSYCSNRQVSWFLVKLT